MPEDSSADGGAVEISRVGDLHPRVGREPGVGRAPAPPVLRRLRRARRSTGSTDGDDELHTAAPAVACRPASCRPTTGGLVVVLDDGLHVVDPDAGDDRAARAVPRRARGPGQRRLRRPRRQPHHRHAQPRARRGFGVVVLGAGAGGGCSTPTSRTPTAPPSAVLDGADDPHHRRHLGGVLLVPLRPGGGDRRASARSSATSSALEGAPDGATLDADGGLWCALVGGGQLARFTVDGLDRTLAVPVANPTDVTFGGPGPRPPVRQLGGGGAGRRCRRTRRRAARDRRARPHGSPRASSRPALRRRFWPSRAIVLFGSLAGWRTGRRSASKVRPPS